MQDLLPTVLIPNNERNYLEKFWYLVYGLISHTPLDKTSSSCDPHCAVETPVLQPPSRPNLQHSSLQCLGQWNLKSSFFPPFCSPLCWSKWFPILLFLFFFPRPQHLFSFTHFLSQPASLPPQTPQLDLLNAGGKLAERKVAGRT